MDSVIRNVSDLSDTERHVYESVLGQPLRTTQRVLIQIANDDAQLSPSTAALSEQVRQLPDCYTIWADLSDAEIMDLESAVLQRSDSRPI